MSEIISKAMNSTLGTAKFKAFDELMLDSKSLTPGDEVVNKFSDSNEYWSINSEDVPKTEKEIVKFIMPLSGTIVVRYALRTTDDEYAATMNVYVNGVKLFTTNAWNRDWSEAPNTVLVSANRGDVITIKGLSTRSVTNEGVTSYNFVARFYDIRYNVVEAPRLSMTKSI